MHNFPPANLLRIVDANLNRTLEGLRVCEDITRFALDERKFSASFKSLRHEVACLRKKIFRRAALLKSRNVGKDVGKKTALREKKRKNIADVFYANIQRSKESARVLEEVSKLIDKKISEKFKKIRFRIYGLEKKSRAKI